MKLTDHTCACNGLTSFECEAHATRNGSYVNLQNLAWKNSWNHLVWTYFLAGFWHLEPLCAVVCSSLPVLAWIHALALQPKLQAEGHTGLYSFVRHRTTCRKTTNIWTATLELTVWSYWLQRPFYYLNYVLMFYVLLTGHQNYFQELKWLLYNNKTRKL